MGIIVNKISRLIIRDNTEESYGAKVDADGNIYVKASSQPGENETALIDAHNKRAQFSAYGLLKTAQENIIGDYRFHSSDFVTEDFDITETGTSSWSLEGEALVLSTGASASSEVNLKSKKIHYYQSGRGQLTKISVILDDLGVIGNTREWGYFDNDNGVFFRMNGTTLQLVIRNATIETVIDSTSWDIPITPDQYGHIYYLQFEWLGVGNIYVYYDEQIVHTYNFLGTSTSFSIANPDLPVTVSNENTTNTSDVIMKIGCMSVMTEGGFLMQAQQSGGLIQPLAVDSSRRLQVALPPPEAPAGTTPVDEVDEITLAKKGGTETYNWIIPTGEIFTLTRFEFNGYVTVGGSPIHAKSKLYWQPNGTTTGEVLIKSLYLQGQSESHDDFEKDYVGDGTARFSIVTVNDSDDNGEFFRGIRGYY
jgi:hypothetical protein